MSVDVIAEYSLDPTGVKDNAPGLAKLAADIGAMYAAGKPLPRCRFLGGADLAFSAWPDLAYPRLELVAEGEVRLRPQGNCPIIFDASLRDPTAALPTNNMQPGVGNMSVDGFNVYATVAPVTVSFRGIHRSKLRLRVINTLAARLNAAIELQFCIITTLEPEVSGGLTGVLLDAWPGKPNLQTTACTIATPCLEGCATGMDVVSAGSCMAYGGTIEGCGLGVHLRAGAGDNVFYSVEMEGNNSNDVTADSGAHNNRLLYCGNGGKLRTNFGLFDSNWAQN